MRSRTALAAALAALVVAGPAAADTFRIEIDYMVDSSPGGHSHMPTQDEIDAVVQMFACQGHTLIVEVSDALTHYNVLQLDPNDQNNFFGYDGTNDSFKAIKDANFDNANSTDGWHYAIFGHQYEWRRQETDGTWTYFNSGSSGLGERNGDDFVVTLGTFTGQTGTPFDKASTLAHEFGHNLGLSHCGVNDCTNIGANPPNLPSIMSYNYQLEGVRSGLLCNELIPPTAGDLFKEIDFSGGRMCDLDESSLDEQLGTSFHRVDWDCSGSVGGTVSQDLSTDGPTWCGNSGNIEVLADYDEWANIASSAGAMPRGSETKHVLEPCISSQEVAMMRASAMATCAQPTLSTENCLSRAVVYVANGGGLLTSGRCNDPVGSVGAAASTAPANSALVLKPQTYNETGTGSLVISSDVRIYATSKAIIR